MYLFTMFSFLDGSQLHTSYTSFHVSKTVFCRSNLLILRFVDTEVKVHAVMSEHDFTFFTYMIKYRFSIIGEKMLCD